MPWLADRRGGAAIGRCGDWRSSWPLAASSPTPSGEWVIRLGRYWSSARRSWPGSTRKPGRGRQPARGVRLHRGRRGWCSHQLPGCWVPRSWFRVKPQGRALLLDERGELDPARGPARRSARSRRVRRDAGRGPLDVGPPSCRRGARRSNATEDGSGDDQLIVSSVRYWPLGHRVRPKQRTVRPVPRLLTRRGGEGAARRHRRSALASPFGPRGGSTRRKLASHASLIRICSDISPNCAATTGTLVVQDGVAGVPSQSASNVLTICSLPDVDCLLRPHRSRWHPIPVPRHSKNCMCRNSTLGP